MASAPVLYLVACAAPPTRQISTMVDLARAQGWQVCLIVTPTASQWLAEDIDALAAATGHPVRSRYKHLAEPDVLPPPDAILVCPATFNTLNKWAAPAKCLGVCRRPYQKVLRIPRASMTTFAAPPHSPRAHGARKPKHPSELRLRSQGGREGLLDLNMFNKLLNMFEKYVE